MADLPLQLAETNRTRIRDTMRHRHRQPVAYLEKLRQRLTASRIDSLHDIAAELGDPQRALRVYHGLCVYPRGLCVYPRGLCAYPPSMPIGFALGPDAVRGTREQVLFTQERATCGKHWEMTTLRELSFIAKCETSRGSIETLGLRPLNDFRVAPCPGVPAHPFIPWSRRLLGSRPLQDFQVAASGDARRFIPWTRWVLGSGPLYNFQVASPGGIHARRFVPWTRAGSKPL